MCTVVHLVYFSPFQDMKNAELALFELSRVISLEPDHPEVFEQRAEVSIFSVFSDCWRSCNCTVFPIIF